MFLHRQSQKNTVKRHLIAILMLAMATLTQAQQTSFYGPQRLGSTLITAITQTADGLLWVGTESGLNRFDGYRFIIIRSLGTTEGGRPTEVSVLYEDNAQRLWVGTARGLYVHDRAADRFLTVAFPDSLEPRVATLSSLPDGRIAAGTAGYGTFVVDATTMEAQPQTGAIPAGDDAFVYPIEVTPQLRAMAPQGVELTCTVKDRAGNRYIGTRGDGLFWIPAGEHTMQRMEVAVSGLDLDRTRVEALYVDRLGNLWVGCQQKGLLMVALHRKPLFTTWSFAAQRQETGTCVSAMAMADNGGLWCTVQGDGVYGFAADGRIVAHPSAPVGVETLMRDSHGRYWLGSTDGLWAYNPATGAAVHCAPMKGERVNVIHELSDGRLAVSTFGTGLRLFDVTTNQVVRRMTMHDSIIPGHGRLANDWIFDLDTDARGRLWIGTSSGVCCYDPLTDSYVTEGWSTLADREKCTALKVLTSGEVILACEHGIMRWTKDGGLQPVKSMEPMRGKTVSSIVEDENHEVWISTNEGIWHWNPQEETLMAYVGAFGLSTREFVQGAGLLMTDGHIAFGTADGMVSFCPDSLKQAHTTAKRLHLTAFVVGSEEANTLTRSNGRRVMDKPVGDCHEFSLSYVDAAFRMEFSLLNFADTEDVSLEYRMDGERRWQQTAKGENAIAFNHLAPGTYRLEVRALTGGETTPTETFVIKVRPPWWRSTWAYLTYLLLLIGGAIGGSIAYKRNIQRQLDQEKLHFLMSAINTQDAPLTLDELKRAVGSFVQSRKHQHMTYGNSAKIADRMDLPEVKGHDEALMERVVQSVNRHLGDSEYSVEQLCTEAAISRAHLHRKMKEMTGLSVTEFIRNIRLEQAARLLREQKLNITQVAYTVGFSNLGYFSTIFRKHFGASPRDFVANNEDVNVNGNDSENETSV